ncbi:hypothetical protein YC2023_024127 [Brassica napus]
MPPKKSTDASTSGDLSDFRKDLLALQESMQATMHASFMEMGAMLADRLARQNPLLEDAETEDVRSIESNLFDSNVLMMTNVDDYAEEFSLILTRTEIYDSAEHLVSRFIGGLRPQLQTALSQFDPLTIAEAHRSAVTFEQKQQRSSTWTGQSTHSRQEEPTTSPTTSPTGAKETDGQQQAPRQADDQNIPPPIASTTPPTTLLFSYSTFLSEMRTEGLAFALLQTTPHHSMQTTPTPSLVTVLDDSLRFLSGISPAKHIKSPMLLVVVMAS